MDANTDKIYILVTYRKVFKDNEVTEKSCYVDRNLINEVDSKQSLVKLLNFDTCRDVNFITLLRKSKKQRDYVALESSEDFKSLMRSLRVKNHIRMVIIDTFPYSTRDSREDPIEWKGMRTNHFASFGETILDSIMENLKEVLGDTLKTTKVKDVNEVKGQEFQIHAEVVHKSVTCDVCSHGTFKPLKGVRYSCLVCSEFDLCEACERNLRDGEKTFRSHNYKHPLAKFVVPDISSRMVKSSLYDKFENFLSKKEFTLKGDEICLELFNSLKNLSEVTPFDEFFKKIDCLLENNRSYEESSSLIDLKDNSDDELKSTSTNEFSSSQCDVFETEHEQHSETVCINTKRYGQSSQVISISLTNDSSYSIPGDELKFEFRNQFENNTTIVRYTEAIKPGQTRFFNLSYSNDKLEDLNGLDLIVSASSANLVMKGEYNYKKPSILKLYTQDARESIVNEADVRGHCVSTLNDVEISVIAKSPSLAQLMVWNRSTNEIDCSELHIEFTNCFDDVVANVLVRKVQSIMPSRVSKFNIPINSTHLKFPFKINFDSSSFRGQCELSPKNMNGMLVYEFYDSKRSRVNTEQRKQLNEDVLSVAGKELEYNDATVDQSKYSDSIDEMVEASSSEYIPGKGEISISTSRSMILPTLPKESMTDSSSSSHKKVEIAVNSHECIDDLERDFELVSVEEGSDFDSDYEVLSPVDSNSNAV